MQMLVQSLLPQRTGLYLLPVRILGQAFLGKSAVHQKYFYGSDV